MVTAGNYTVTDEAWFDVEILDMDGPGADFRLDEYLLLLIDNSVEKYFVPEHSIHLSLEYIIDNYNL